MNKKGILAIILIAVAITTTYYAYQFFKKEEVLRVSTTTSLYATGLLDKLAEEFKKIRGDVVIQFIPVGSGAALRLAGNGDVDMVFVHAPNLEKEYIESGVLINGTIIAYNYFVIVGPPDDPAGIKNMTPIEAMKKIFAAGENGTIKFVSRGDNSGTHVRELLLWKMAGHNASGKSWYIETGSGMSDTLLVANEYGAYTLSDIGTFLKLKKEGRLPYLDVLVSQGDILINIYSIYLVNPDKYPHTKYKLAKEFLDFVKSEKGQNIIESYGVPDLGEQLFHAAKGKEVELKEKWQWLANFTMQSLLSMMRVG